MARPHANRSEVTQPRNGRAAARYVPRVKGKRSPKAKSTPKAKPTRKAARKGRSSDAAWPRDLGLEQAILDAPLDPVPRMVYADWLQAAGDRRGEWMALHSAIEAEPTNVRLRSAAVDFLGSHLDLLLGPGKSLLAGGWIGWRAGFIDELRVQPSHKRGAIEAFRSLLAHPSCRFVRAVGLGGLGQEAIDALVDAAPPLLDTVVVVDSDLHVGDSDVDALLEVPTLRRLGLRPSNITKPAPQLVEVASTIAGWVPNWLIKGNAPNLERLTLDCQSDARFLPAILAALPRLKQLRLLHVATSMLPATFAPGLELIDLSYGRITDADVERFVGWKGLTLLLLRTPISAGAISRLRASGVEVIASAGTSRIDQDHEPGSWLHHRLAVDGRDGLQLIPAIGRTLFNVGTHHSIDGDPKDATPLLDAALTFPNEHLKTWAWANAAIAHERLLEFDDAELIAREGLLRTPKEPNLYAIIVDALRRTNRLAEAIALLPRALSSIKAAPGPGAHAGGRAACLADVLFVLAQAGRHDEVLELAGEYEKLLDQRVDMYAIVAMSLVALGDVPEARKALAKATGSRFAGVLAHAKAVVALAAKKPDVPRVIELLRSVKAAPYPEWHWIAKDRNLAKLANYVAFVSLVSS
jgi:uncharacterized protein (TIGR02996 family)